MAKPLGMMSGAYFIGRGELLEWVNNLLCVSYDKVEDTSNGAAFCQIIDAIHPGTVNLGRVNFNAITEAEMIENYKVLQDAFDKNGITQYIDVATLCKGKYMAALELFQWIHAYFEQQGASNEYDGAARRKQYRCKDPGQRARMINKKPAGMARRKDGVQVAAAPLKAKPGHIPGAPESKVEKAAPPARAQKKVADEPPSGRPGKAAAAPKADASRPAVGGSAEDSKTIKNLKKQITELQEEVEQMNQERDFYYEKLRKIEDYCQDHENGTHVKNILDLLYEADESRGFLPPDDDDDE